MIHSILTNPTYTGDLAQGRSRVKSYKVHEVESVPREEWVEVAGTHEAIIDYETFDKVQALLQRDTRTSPKGREVHLFSGFLKCADCERAITRSVGNNNNVYYACSTYKNRSRTACTMHSIKHNRLEAAVLFAVQQQIHLAVSYSEMIARINLSVFIFLTDSAIQRLPCPHRPFLCINKCNKVRPFSLIFYSLTIVS